MPVQKGLVAEPPVVAARRPQRPGQSPPIPREFADIRARLPHFEPSVIFDVGANVGQSALAYSAAFPAAQIHAFEPVPTTFRQLSAAVRDRANVHVHQLALSRAEGAATMLTQADSTLSRVTRAGAAETGVMVEVRTRPGHAVAAELGVGLISYLKIDTEGHDLEVLRGFEPVLDDVDFVQVEASMNPYNKTHVPFRDMEDYLRAQGFLLFGFYDQTMEWQDGGRPVLRRTNPLFVNRALVDLRGLR